MVDKHWKFRRTDKQISGGVGIKVGSWGSICLIKDGGGVLSTRGGSESGAIGSNVAACPCRGDRQNYFLWQSPRTHVDQAHCPLLSEGEPDNSVLKMQHSRMEMVSLAINPISGNDIKDELWRSRQMIRR
jgi:hypothetical protein